MTWATTGAFICYLIAAVGSIGFGIVYLARSTFMPYHRDAISTPWEKLEKPYQALFLALIKVAGGGFLVSNELADALVLGIARGLAVLG